MSSVHVRYHLLSADIQIRHFFLCSQCNCDESRLVWDWESLRKKVEARVAQLGSVRFHFWKTSFEMHNSSSWYFCSSVSLSLSLSCSCASSLRGLRNVSSSPLLSLPPPGSLCARLVPVPCHTLCCFVIYELEPSALLQFAAFTCSVPL